MVVEKKIVDAAVDKASGAEKVAKTYTTYILFDESFHEAKYNEELTESSGTVDFDSIRRKAGFISEVKRAYAASSFHVGEKYTKKLPCRK